MKNPEKITIKKVGIVKHTRKRTTLENVEEYRLIENLTLANDIANQPIIFGIAAIIKDCKLTEQSIVNKQQTRP